MAPRITETDEETGETKEYCVHSTGGGTGNVTLTCPVDWFQKSKEEKFKWLSKYLSEGK